MIYRIGDIFEEVRTKEFTRAGATIAAGTLLGGVVWAQIVSTDVRIYDSGKTVRRRGLMGRCEYGSIGSDYG